ncbi:MAG: hypothetical protein L0Z50_02650 [Verrucomicrobiales bacterium]|nr:hypothetical protein [Verrucomicrobiales bacterium]
MDLLKRLWPVLLTCVPAFSVPAGAAVNTPLALSVALETNRVSVSWIEPAGGAFLEVTDQPGLNGPWWPARLASSADGDRRTVVLTPASTGRFYRLTAQKYSTWLQTTQGPVTPGAGLLVLPHEHLFTDLRGPTTPGYAVADVEDVLRVMTPLVVEARENGIGLLVECSSIGVGRNIAVIHRLSQESGLPVVVPTGVYGRANFAPPEYRDMTEDQLTELFTKEIRDGIEGTDIKAGFIKISTSDTVLTAREEKFLRAAGRAAQETGAVVASHTISGSVARRQVDVLNSISPSIRFVWVHAQVERNRRLHRELAARGVFVEFDSLGWQPSEDTALIAAIKELLAAGYGDRILLSHDAGWYQPGQPNGGTQKPYTYLVKTFIPKLKNNGVDDATIRMLTEENPVRAFAFMTRSNP